jgi:hypothetical protein
MSKENKDPGSITQVGHPKAPEPPKEKPADQGFADTLPNVRPNKVQLQSSNTTDNLVTSAPVRAVAGHAQASGAVTLTGERVAESLARELIFRRMGNEGFELTHDFAFSYEDLLVTLDGFDEQRKVGFQYVSHADADVVTDVDSGVEERLRELSMQGIIQVLVIHDHDATTADIVLERVESFLATLPANR